MGDKQFSSHLSIRYLRMNAGRTCLMIVCVSCGEYDAMIETGNELQLSDDLLLLSHVATVVGFTEVLFQPSFFLRRSTLLLAEHEVYNALVVVWSGRRSTLRITEPDTARTETERAPRVSMRHISTTAVCVEPKRQMHTLHAWIVPSCVVSARTVHVVLEPTLRAW